MNAYNYFLEQSSSLDKDFLLGNRETLSYEFLFKDSLFLAQSIRERFGENNNILLIAPNSAFFVTVYLAIIKSGNVCVPLNPDTEARNLAFIMDLCKASIAFIAPPLSGRDWPGITTLIDTTDPGRHNTLDPLHYGLWVESFDEERLAEIIFTSGSTGEPKGVMITHRNLIANTSSIIEYLGLGISDTVEVVMPFYYCYGLSLLHTHLRVGGSVVFNNSFILLGSVLKDLVQHRCTGFAGVPSHFQILLRKSTTFKTSSFPHLRYVTQAGGKLHNAFLEEFTEAFPNIRFYVMYGQTEATARLSWLPPDMLKEKMGSMGRAIPGVELDLRDEKGNPVTEPGKVGEVVARGDNIMKGYLGDEEGTAATLKDGWLHTGDLAYRDKDGYFFLTARKKEIIKVGGKRVSPKEIEEVIVSLPQVVDCSVAGVEDEVLGEALQATVILSDPKDSTTDAEAIQAWCARHLAPFKVPSLIRFESRMDIANTGKKVKKTAGPEAS
jgi:long-chain acyl-CoA synthetase